MRRSDPPTWRERRATWRIIWTAISAASTS